MIIDVKKEKEKKNMVICNHYICLFNEFIVMEKKIIKKQGGRVPPLLIKHYVNPYNDSKLTCFLSPMFE